MRKPICLILLNIVFVLALCGRTKVETESLLSENDLTFLKGLTIDVMESSRIYPGQSVSDEFGSNNTGGVLMRPGAIALSHDLMPTSYRIKITHIIYVNTKT